MRKGFVISCFAVIIVILMGTGMCLFFCPHVIPLDVTSVSAREMLDRCLWGEKFDCVNYVKGAEIHLHDSDEKLKCTIDMADPSWARFEVVMSNQWDEVYWNLEENDAEMAFVESCLKEVDFTPGTFVCEKQKKDGSGNLMLLIREPNGCLVMYIWNLTLPRKVIEKLRLR